MGLIGFYYLISFQQGTIWNLLSVAISLLEMKENDLFVMEVIKFDVFLSIMPAYSVYIFPLV